MGKFIAIEGGDGSGKGTHSELLQQFFISKGNAVTKISFPRYGSDSAFYVEKYLNGAYGQANDVPADLGVLPYAIDRYAASSDIRLALATENSIVIADRYMASNLAHQGAKIDDTDERAAFYERTKITEYGVLGIPKPDQTIVLVMPTEHMQSNVDKKAAREYTTMKRDIHEADASHLEKAKSNFEELCTLYPGEFKAVYCTDTAGAMRPIEEIQAEIRSLVTKASA
jgi:dTMP kinase